MADPVEDILLDLFHWRENVCWAVLNIRFDPAGFHLDQFVKSGLQPLLLLGPQNSAVGIIGGGPTTVLLRLTNIMIVGGAEVRE